MSSDSLDLLSARDRQGVAHHLRFAEQRATNGNTAARAVADATGNSTVRDQAEAAGNSGENFFGEDGFGFEDFLDMINPLQHLPIISTIYRAATGDEIAPGARIIGGAVFGGPIGLAAAIANAAVEDASGKDIGALALAAIGLDGEDVPGDAPATAPATMLAAAEIPAAASPQALSNEAPIDGSSAKPLSDIAPASGAPAASGEPASHRQAAVDLPELSQDQLALLLSSVGLKQHDLPAARQVAMEAPATASAITASLINADQTGDPYWSARAMLETFGGRATLPQATLSDDNAPARGKLVNSNL